MATSSFDSNRRMRALTTDEISLLEKQGNQSADWPRVSVRSESFDAALIQDCLFCGNVRIGRLAPGENSAGQYKLPVGLRRAMLIDCSVGDNVAIEDCLRLERVTIGDSVLLWRVGRIQNFSPARFGCGGAITINGKQVRSPLHLQNENGRRAVLAWPEMTVGMAAFWVMSIGQPEVIEKLNGIADAHTLAHADDFSEIGAAAALIDCRTLINVKIGPAARLEGTEWLEELTVLSDPSAPTVIGTGVELRRGIVGYGNRIDGGARARDFATGENVELDLGAVVTHSFIGDVSHIARGELSNALIYPHHQQHHRNSFVIAARIEGQSNIAAGVTLGSNHNSRAADGEIVAGRGFWPGLCTNFKHNSCFAPFILVAKGNYPYELKIPFPFSLVSNSDDGNELRIAPGWLWMHNAYALLRNEWKFALRDKRHFKRQFVEIRALAPDTVEVMLTALSHIDTSLKGAGRSERDHEDNPVIYADAERSRRSIILIRPVAALNRYRELCVFYAGSELLPFLFGAKSKAELQKKLEQHRALVEGVGPHPLSNWKNIGGQMIMAINPDRRLHGLDCSDFSHLDHSLKQSADDYSIGYRYIFAAGVLRHLDSDYHGSAEDIRNLAANSASIYASISEVVRLSRQKDFADDFRKLTCDSTDEFAAAFGSAEDDPFITEFEQKYLRFKEQCTKLLELL